MKKETRGRKPKIIPPLGVSFDEVLKAVAASTYKPRKKPKRTRKKRS